MTHARTRFLEPRAFGRIVRVGDAVGRGLVRARKRAVHSRIVGGARAATHQRQLDTERVEWASQNSGG